MPRVAIDTDHEWESTVREITKRDYIDGLYIQKGCVCGDFKHANDFECVTGMTLDAAIEEHGHNASYVYDKFFRSWFASADEHANDMMILCQEASLKDCLAEMASASSASSSASASTSSATSTTAPALAPSPLLAKLQTLFHLLYVSERDRGAYRRGSCAVPLDKQWNKDKICAAEEMAYFFRFCAFHDLDLYLAEDERDKA